MIVSVSCSEILGPSFKKLNLFRLMYMILGPLEAKTKQYGPTFCVHNLKVQRGTTVSALSCDCLNCDVLG